MEQIQVYLVLSCFALADVAFFFFFNKLNVCGNGLNKSIGVIFLIALAHFMSLCHILVILTIFQAFSSSLYFLW